jgi:hypothetical protein
MKNALIVAVLALGAWFAYTRATGPSADESTSAAVTEVDDASELFASDPAPKFSCDGRTHCSQMTSCAEAEFFLRNCPGVEMDGNNDNEPCGSQWCGNSR